MKKKMVLNEKSKTKRVGGIAQKIPMEKNQNRKGKLWFIERTRTTKMMKKSGRKEKNNLGEQQGGLNKNLQ